MSQRSNQSLRITSTILCAVILLVCPCIACAESPRILDSAASELLPNTTVAFAESSDLGEVLQTILDHPLRGKLEALPAYAAFIQSAPMGRLQTGVRAFEASMGKPWHEAIDILTDRGISVALDASEGSGLAVLMRSSDPELLGRFRGFLLALTQMQGGAAQRGDYRGFSADMVGDNIKMVQIHDWLLLTNNSELGKAIIDRSIDHADDSLATHPSYTAARADFESHSDSNPLVFAFANLQTLRDAGVAKALYREKTDNIAVEMGIGGILANLRQTPYMTGQMQFNPNGVSVRFAMPHEREWEAPREYFFGETQPALSPALLDVPNRLFALSTHRDLSQLWLRSGDLLSDRANDQLAVADATLTTLFSGRDFGEDILGSFESDIQIVGMQQDFTDVLPQPAIKLPAFAIQFRMKDAERTQPELRRVFQSLIGFLNITGAQNAGPQLDLGMEKTADAELVTANYVPDQAQRESLDLPIQFNLSPTLAFVGNHIILSSSTALARQLVQPAETVQSTGHQSSNTTGELTATTLRRVLQSNQSQLVANSMLEKGHSKQAAEAEIGLLLELLGYFNNLQLDLTVTDTDMALETAIQLN